MPTIYRPIARPLVARVASLFLSLWLLLLPDAAAAQDAPPRPSADERLRIYLDCPTGGCDRNFFITEMPYAIWTQNPQDADIHLLITRITTGSGGSEYTMQFIAQRRMGTGADTLITSTPPNTSDDTRRRSLARMIQIGVAGRAARLRGGAGFTDRLSVSYEPLEGVDIVDDGTQSDRWNLWVYRADVNGNGSAESRESNYELSAGFNARRITDTWKLEFDFENEYNARRFELSDGSERQFVLRSADFSSRIVRSLSEHWSIGTTATAGLSEFRNQDAYGSANVSAEWNYFPWAEATSRQLIALVALGGRHFDYAETTLYGRDAETRPLLRAVIAGESRQQWGSANASLRYTQYLHEQERYNLSFFGRTNLRITRGLSLELRGEAAKVQDQLYLPRGDVSDDEVLTRQRALATAFRLSGSVGLSFTFGSIYNNIVNPRLDDLRN